MHIKLFYTAILLAWPILTNVATSIIKNPLTLRWNMIINHKNGWQLEKVEDKNWRING